MSRSEWLSEVKDVQAITAPYPQRGGPGRHRADKRCVISGNLLYCGRTAVDGATVALEKAVQWSGWSRHAVMNLEPSTTSLQIVAAPLELSLSSATHHGRRNPAGLAAGTKLHPTVYGSCPRRHE